MADALAESAAVLRQAPVAITRLLDCGKEAVRFASTLLGRVTHAANSHKVPQQMPDGSVKYVAMRDAQQPEGQRYKRKTPGGHALAQPTPPSQPVIVTPKLCNDGHEPRGPGRRVDEIGASLSPATNTVAASERLSQLARRVKARLS